MSGDPAFSWMTKHGEMAGRIRNIDWSKSPLGEPSEWPQSLKTTINICLSSKFPMYVWWGSENINFYNDAYISIVGSARHPRFLGRPAEEMWSELWPTMNGWLDEIYASAKSVVKKQNEATISFGPAFDDDGEVCGVVAIVLSADMFS